jgi:hypothetical protein
MKKFKVGDVVQCINNNVLEGNEFGPSKILLRLAEHYTIKDIIEDSQGNQHLDIGLKSIYNYIRSWETKEELTRGDKVQWCHPSRFNLL